jgi:beta-N-acetylhexosaminidase
MNQEERRQKRQKDTRNARIAIIILVIAIVLIAGALILGIRQLMPVGETKEPENTETELATETEEVFSTEEIQPTETQDDTLDIRAAEYVAGMTLEEKIAQMFVVTPDALVGKAGVTAAGDTTKNSYNDRPVGGIVYMSSNLLDREQTETMLSNMQNIAQERMGLPVLLCVDEEGGSVARIAGNSAFEVTDVGTMSTIGATGDSQNAYQAGSTIGAYLSELGFNVDFAPVADVLTNDANTIGDRSFGTDASLVADMVSAELSGLSEQNVYGVVKHFPGHGGASSDSHDGRAVSERTLEELTAEEFVPFQRAIDENVSFVMVGHISLPNVTGDNTPATLSPVLVTDVLRNQMGYDGIIITDAMNMKAITDIYNSDNAAILAVTAGADMILMPGDFDRAYNGLLTAVQNGTISEERINESVTRIIKLKLQMAE